MARLHNNEERLTIVGADRSGKNISLTLERKKETMTLKYYI